MLNKFDICVEIGNTFGDFYVDVSGILTIETYNEIYTYKTEDELLRDWLPKLEEADSVLQDDYWIDIINYIREEIL